MQLSKLTTDLIDVYLAMIGSDHHKQADGYFSIAQVYCGYSYEPYSWEVTHDGYINQGRAFADTFEEAEVELQKMVCGFIEDTIQTYIRCTREPDVWDIMFPTNMLDLIQKFEQLKGKIND